MGVCFGTNKAPQSGKVLYYKLIESIEKDAAKKLSLMISSLSRDEETSTIGNITIRINSLELSPLGYALYIGSTDAFTVLFAAANEDFECLWHQFQPLWTNPLEIVCEMGYIGILKYILPIYLNNREHLTLQQGDCESSVPKLSQLLVPVSTRTPVQRACEKGRIDMLKFIVNSFAERTVPIEFDIHSLDELTGENCALSSCKVGNLALIKYLHEECHADFRVLNKRYEGAMQLCAAWSKKNKMRNFLSSVEYLIETVGVDFVHDCEEALLVLEDKNIVQYLECKLKEKGVLITKDEVERKYSLSRNRGPNQVDPRLEDKLDLVRGTNFNFSELFKEELEESKYSMSVISQQQSRNFSHLLLDFSQVEVGKGNE